MLGSSGKETEDVSLLLFVLLAVVMVMLERVAESVVCLRRGADGSGARVCESGACADEEVDCSGGSSLPGRGKMCAPRSCAKTTSGDVGIRMLQCVKPYFLMHRKNDARNMSVKRRRLTNALVLSGKAASFEVSFCSEGEGDDGSELLQRLSGAESARPRLWREFLGKKRPKWSTEGGCFGEMPAKMSCRQIANRRGSFCRQTCGFSAAIYCSERRQAGMFYEIGMCLQKGELIWIQ